MTSNRSKTIWPRWARGTRGLFLLSVCLVFARAQAQDPAVGLHYGSDFSRTQYENFGNWLGRPVTYRVSFMEKKTWATMTDLTYLHIVQAWVKSAPGRAEVISMGMIPDAETGGFAVITSGSKDSYFKSFASKLQSAGVADKVIIRLGWEANGNWYKWSLQPNPSGFKSAWRRIVQVMRSVAPKLRFEFNISNLAGRGTTGAKWSDGYPGNDVVDVISMDIYDHWNTWDRMMNGDAGLAEMRRFAVANNKPEAFTEWSCSTTKNGHGDSPTFIRNMANWMRARPGGILYQAYWNTEQGANGMVYGSSVPVPNAAAEYRRQFGPVASAPTISKIANQLLTMNTTTGPIAFTVGDGQTAAGSLLVSANASNLTLLPLANITFGGSGANRTITVSPTANKTGWSTVWIKVSDGALSTVTSFVVNVSGLDTAASAPTISAIANQTAPANGDTGEVAFTINDAETPAANLSVTANSSDQTIVPTSNIALEGVGANRTVTVRPVLNKTGSTTVAITVNDSQRTTTRSFAVNVIGGLTLVDVGNPAIAGSLTESSTNITMRAGGYDIYNLRDEFSFAQRTLTGDVELTVRVASLTRAHDWTKAGLMFRGSNANDAAFAAVFVTPTKGVVLQWRALNGGGCRSSVALPGSAPKWIRLTRSANSFYAFASNDGVMWDLVETVDVDLPDSAVAGLAVTSHMATTATTAVFDRFAID